MAGERRVFGAAFKATVALAAAKGDRTTAQLPQRPFESRRVADGTVNSESLVRFETNDYSVPVCYAHRKVIVIATVDEVRFVYEDRLLARYPQVLGSREGVF